MTKINLLNLKSIPIFQQLAIEEALLRCDHENWCIINEGSKSSIVMGIGAKAEDVIDLNELKNSEVLVIRRFSGGGTVVVDNKTIFVSFIFQKNTFKELEAPRTFMEWTEQFYLPVFKPHDFKLIENDYAIGLKKVGGNAQYFTKSSSLHHSTFLWDYDENLMKLLKMPKAQPKYREKREHGCFLDKLNKYFLSPEEIKEKIMERLSHYFQIDTTRVHEIPFIMEKPHRKALELIEF